MTVRRVLGVTTKSRLLPFVRYSSISYAFIVFALCELHDRVTSLCFFPSLSLSFFFFFVRIKLGRIFSSFRTREKSISYINYLITLSKRNFTIL